MKMSTRKEYWSVGVLEYWSVGVMESGYFGFWIADFG
jgi:hypothetical protein